MTKYKSINLNTKGIKVYKGSLFLHDYLWFSSSEISKVSTTIPVIHNYALSYALNQFSYAIFVGNTPKYEEDFKKFNCYATPSISLCSIRETMTYNAMDEKTLTTGDSTKKINSPNYGWKNVVVPTYLPKSDKDSLYAFKFYVFTYGAYKLPSIVRIGKKGASCRIYWNEVENPIAKYSEKSVSPSHPVNPLDVSGNVIQGDVVKIPPHSFYRIAIIKEDWFIFGSNQVVHIPERIFKKINAN